MDEDVSICIWRPRKCRASDCAIRDSGGMVQGGKRKATDGSDGEMTTPRRLLGSRVPDRLRTRRRITLRRWFSRTSVALGGLLLLYVGSYAFLSSFGSYVLTQSGKLRWNITGLSVSDMYEWRPLMVRYHRFKSIDGAYETRANAIGRFYRPLLAFDRSHWHKSRRLIEGYGVSSSIDNTGDPRGRGHDGDKER